MNRPVIIPVFIPQEGCPVQCSYCDQTGLTGVKDNVSPADVARVLALYVEKSRDERTVELAFYGGSFTALPPARQEAFLTAASDAHLAGRIHRIRVSTRPDCIDEERLDLLMRYGVGTVELGVQSMDDSVLSMNRRGHSADDTRRAIKLLKQRGFRFGIQLMPGLIGDSPSLFMSAVDELISLGPDMARVYPAVVLKNTLCEQWYRQGRYEPSSLDDMVTLCARALLRFRRAGVPVIRLGLQSSCDLEDVLVAGPYHPAFRQLVESEVALWIMGHLHACTPAGDAPFYVHPRYLSTALGQKKENLRRFQMRYNHAPKLMVDGSVPYEALRRGHIIVTPTDLQPDDLNSFTKGWTHE